MGGDRGGKQWGKGRDTEGSSADRRFFDRMLKGGDAFQRVDDGKRFLAAACAYDDKLDLLVQLDNPRFHGAKVLRNALASADTVLFFNHSVLPFLAVLGSDAVTAATMCHAAVEQIIDVAYSLPGFVKTLYTHVEKGLLPDEATIGWFILRCCREREDARRDDGNFARRIAELFIERNGPAARQLRTVLGIDIENVDDGVTVGLEDVRREAGGRHDNDLKDFRSISIMPTLEELGCTEGAFLPKNGNTEAALLDRQFRLLREDIVGSARVDLAKLQDGQGNRRNVYEHVAVEWATTQNDKGRACIMISFSLPKTHKSKRYQGKERITFFEKECGGLLPVDAFVCLAFNGNPIFVATVVVREGKFLAKERPEIGLEFQGKTTEVADLLKYCSIGPLEGLQIIQVSTNFFAYVPVLTALQKSVDVPMTEEIVGLRTHSSPPPYLQDVALTRIKPTLDESQRAAVALAMRSRVAIVQGPPGTGKTYVGVNICDIILKETAETILCVCYTNHALDQFLESLLDIGITQIVRIGGRSKSQRLEPYNIRELAFSSRDMRPPAAKRRVAILKENLQTLQDTIKRLSYEVGGELRPSSWSTICDYLEDKYPDVYRQLCLPEGTDGFSHVGKRGKKLTPDCVWQKWARGKQPPKILTNLQSPGPLWHLDLKERQEKMEEWNHDLTLDNREALAEALDAFRLSDKELRNLHKESYATILRQARVIGCTTTGAAMHVPQLAAAAPGVIVVEEAAEILESHVITSLHPKVKHLIMIGDHKQLRPKLENYELSVVSGNQHDLNRSMFERLVLSGYEHATLQVQHRMRPEISRLIKSTYPMLEDHSSVLGRESLRGLSTNVIFIDHDVEETKVDNWKASHESKTNYHEVEMVCAIVVYMLQQGYKAEQIVVITPYLGQLLAIQRDLRKKKISIEVGDKDISDMRQAAGSQAEYMPGIEKGVQSVRVATIDNYQGEEADIIIGSLVRNNPDRGIGFLREPERVNVLLSRAKLGLVLLGSRACLSGARSREGAKLWTALFHELDAHQQVTRGFPTICPSHCTVKSLETAAAFNLHVPHGGCTRECAKDLPCGHACPMKCHSWPSHEDISCSRIVSCYCDKGHLMSHECGSKLEERQCSVCNDIRKLERAREKELEELQAAEAKQMEQYALRRAEMEKTAGVLQEKLDQQRRKEEVELAEEKRKCELWRKEQELKMGQSYGGDELKAQIAAMKKQVEKEVAEKEAGMAAARKELEEELRRQEAAKAKSDERRNYEQRQYRNDVYNANQSADNGTAKKEQQDATRRNAQEAGSQLLSAICDTAKSRGDLRATLAKVSKKCLCGALCNREDLACIVFDQAKLPPSSSPHQDHVAYRSMANKQFLSAFDVLSAEGEASPLFGLCQFELGYPPSTSGQTDSIEQYLKAALLDRAIDKQEVARDSGLEAFGWALACLVHPLSDAIIRDQAYALLTKYGRIVPSAGRSKGLFDMEAKWEKQAGTSTALRDLLKLTGLKSVKKLFFELSARIELDIERKLDFTKQQFSLRFDGNPGTGKTTVARLYAVFLKERKVISADTFVETSGAALLNGGPEELKKHLKNLEKGGVLFIDEAYQLNPDKSQAGAQVLDTLLPEMENLRGKLVVIMAGYSKKMDDLFSYNEGLPSRFPHTFTFVDYTDQELLTIFLNIVKSGPFRLKHDRFARIASRRLGQQRGTVGFGNARACRTLYDNALTQQATRVLLQRDMGLLPEVYLLERDDVLGPRSIDTGSCPSLQKLKRMRGLKCVKESIDTLLKTVQTNSELEEQERPLRQVTLNRVFLGNPGTGKTTVASIYGKILNALGLLSKGEVMVRCPQDFIGSVLGESEKKTKAILDAARGNVLVIDEAYGLHASKNTTDPYKVAVVDTIVAEVQGVPGDDRCVLLLGYKEPMETMIRDANPGLARRFQISDAFYFEDYNDEDLLAILSAKVAERQMELTLPVARAAIAVLAQERRQPNFGNAGAINNLLSRATQKMEARLKDVAPSARADATFVAGDFTTAEQDENRNLDPKTLFDGLVGCEQVREKLENLQTTIAFAQKLGKDPLDEMELNFFFAGSPGTGKTTVARRMGKMFASLGLLGSSNVVECSASDFLTGYANQAAGKTREIFRSALGKVLFVDEAYRLNPNIGGPMMSEVLDEIVQLLTEVEFRNKMVVIFAGYAIELNALLDVNPGLKSRVSEHILFTDFTPDVAAGLLRELLVKKGLKLEDSINITPLMQKLSKAPHWSNGRDVETLGKRIFQAVGQAAKKTDPVVTQAILQSTVNKFVDEKVASEPCKPSRAPMYSSMETASKMSPPSPATATSTNVESEVDTEEEPNGRTTTQPSRFAGLPQKFLEEVQDVLLTNGVDITNGQDILEFAETKSMKKFDADLLAKWKAALQEAFAEEQRLAEEIAQKKRTRRPRWRCAICGRPHCRVAPYIEGYDDI